MLPTEEGGLVKNQMIGTRSLLFYFGWGDVALNFGGFLDLDDVVVITPGIGPVVGTITMWEDEANQIEPDDVFSIRYPNRVVGYGLVRGVRRDVKL